MTEELPAPQDSNVSPQAEENAAPIPVVSGTKSEQRVSAEAVEGTLEPRPQLGEIAPTVTAAAKGIIAQDPAGMYSPAAQQLFLGHAMALEAQNISLRKDLGDSKARCDSLASDLSRLNAQLAVAESKIESERNYRKTRAVYSFIGIGLVGFGIDRLAVQDYGIAAALILFGLVSAGAAIYFSPTGDKKS